jgi:hypothetical protein
MTKVLHLTELEYQTVCEALEVAHDYAEDAFDGHRNCDDECSKHGPLKKQVDLVHLARQVVSYTEQED